MNVWIFVVSALFAPIAQPLGLVADEPAPAPMVEAAPAAEAAPTAEPRFHGLERMLAQLDAGAR